MTAKYYLGFARPSTRTTCDFSLHSQSRKPIRKSFDRFVLILVSSLDPGLEKRINSPILLWSHMQERQRIQQ